MRQAIQDEKAAKRRLDMMRSSLEAQRGDVSKQQRRVAAEWDRLEELARAADVLDDRVTDEETALRKLAEGLEERKGELVERKRELEEAKQQLIRKHPLWRDRPESEIEDEVKQLKEDREWLHHQTLALRNTMQAWSTQRTVLHKEEWALKRLRAVVQEQRTLHGHAVLVLRRRQEELVDAQRTVIASQDSALDGKAKLSRLHRDLQEDYGELKGEHQMLRGMHKAVSESREDLHEEHGALKHRHHDLHGAHDVLKDELDDLKEIHGNLRSANKKLRSKGRRLQNQHDKLQVKHGALEANFDDLAAAHERLQEEKDALHQQQGSLRASHKELIGEHEWLRDHHHALKEELDAEQAAHENDERIIEAMKGVLQIENESIRSTEEAVDKTLRAVQDCSELHLSRKLRDLTSELNKVS